MARQVEVFSAGCPLCAEAKRLARELACPDCQITIHDVRTDEDALAKAKQYGVTGVPTVVVDGRIATCCVRTEVTARALREAGVGRPA